MNAMPRPRPLHLRHETTRHGEKVWYVRRGEGPRIRLREPFGTMAFWAEYELAVRGQAPEPAARKAQAIGSLGWLIDSYTASAQWRELSPATRAQRAGLLKETKKLSGNAPADTINKLSVQKGMDQRAHQPHGANNWLKTMRGLFGWAVALDLVPADPTRSVKLLKGANDRNGFHEWSEEEVARFEARWPVGTRERLALDILLYTGLRRGDAARLGRPHVRNGVIRIRTEKTDEQVEIRLLDPLAASIAATPTGDLTFIATEKGKPYTKESFGNWFRDVCVATGLPGRAHGLRKAGARRAAENGATDLELNAWFGWADGSRQSAVYTRGANRARLASNLAEKFKPEPYAAPTIPVRRTMAIPPKKTGA